MKKLNQSAIVDVNYPPTAPRNSLDKIAEAWQSSPSAPLLGALLSASIQFAVSLSFHVNSLFEPDYLWWIWVSSQSIVLLFRRRAPFLILIIQCIFMVSAEVFYSAGAFALFHYSYPSIAQVLALPLGKSG